MKHAITILLLLIAATGSAQTWPSGKCDDNPTVRRNSDTIYHSGKCDVETFGGRQYWACDTCVTHIHGRYEDSSNLSFWRDSVLRVWATRPYNWDTTLMNTQVTTVLPEVIGELYLHGRKIYTVHGNFQIISDKPDHIWDYGRRYDYDSIAVKNQIKKSK